MLRRITYIVFLCLLLSGCSEYDSVMKQGKNALKTENYEEAVKQFNYALIEKPQDKDAELLLQQAQEKYNTELAAKSIKEYGDKIAPLMKRSFQVLSLDLSYDKVTAGDISKQIKDLNEIIRDLKDIGRSYDGNPNIKELHDILITSLEEQVSGLNMMIDLLPTLKENAEYEKKYPNRVHAIPRVVDISKMEIHFKNAGDYISDYSKRFESMYK